MRHGWWLMIMVSPWLAQAQQCAVDPLAHYLRTPSPIDNPQALEMQAEQAEGDYQQALLQGDVRVRYQNQLLRADKLFYYPAQGRAEVPESALYASPQVVLQGKALQYDAQHQNAQLEQAEYVFKHGAQPTISQGSAQHIHHQPTQTLLQHAQWSSCARLNPVWSLHSEQLQLDHQQQRAFAYGLRFKVHDNTLFYLPYLSYPLGDERQSGWLTPSFSGSDTQGFSLRLPYYFNLAPNYDATLTLQAMSKRGLMLGSEARYLDTAQSALWRGQWIYDRHLERHRWHVYAQHQWNAAPFEVQTLYQRLSDPRYSEDFAYDGERYADHYLSRYLRVNVPHTSSDHNPTQGQWQLLFQDYTPAHSNATLSQQPYARVPQLSYQAQWSWHGVQLAMHAEASRFYRRDTGHSKRFDAQASVSYRWQEPYGFLEPRLSVRTTHYALSPQLGGQSLHRTLPTLSLDMGLFFERHGDRYTQTLEPRLYYLYTPYRDQSALPLFDTDERQKSWAWLFMPNRFTGADRIGDAHQLTTALSSRWRDTQTGQELARYQIGQIQYLHPPRNYLTKPEDPNRSLLVANVQYQIHPRVAVQALGFYNTQQNRSEYHDVRLRYELDSQRFVQFSRRYDRDHFHQSSLSSVWRWNDQYRSFARLDYHHHHHQFHNLMLGLEYDDCCFGWRLIGKHYRKHPSNNEKHNALYLEFVFKGLGSMGNQTTRLLQKEIHGFQP